MKRKTLDTVKKLLARGSKNKITSLEERNYMTREQIVTTFTDLGLEAPQKGVINALLNAFNQEKSQEVEAAKKTASDELNAKYKDYVKPEDHKKIVDELETEKGKGALATRKAAYEKAKLNIKDEDILNLIDSKLKDSKDFDKDLAEYVKAHPSFVVQEQVEPKPKANPVKVTIGGGLTQNPQENTLDLGSAISEHYNK